MKLSLKNITQSVLIFVVIFSSNTIANDAIQEKSLTFKVGLARAGSSYHCGNSEDRYVIDTRPDLPFFAVFDGHKGTKAADLAKSKLSEYLRDSCILKKHAPDFSDANIERAFERVGQDILNIKNDDSGSTAVTVFFSREKDISYVHVANIGDSSAVLGTDDAFQVLTKEHRPQNESEKERINKFIQKRPKRNRRESLDNEKPRPLKVRNCSAQQKLNFDALETTVWFPIEEKATLKEHLEEIDAVPKNLCFNYFEPQIQNTMLIKEIDTKDYGWTTKTHLEVTRCFGHAHLACEGLICTPDICHIALDKSEGFVILYSDGITDYLPHEEAVKLVREGLSCGKKVKDIAKNLLIEAACREKKIARENEDTANLLLTIKDDMTVIIVQFVL